MILIANNIGGFAMKLYFSDFFEVDEKILDDYGAFNISLINDMPLFIDPFLLFYSNNEQYQNLHDEIIKYLMFLKQKSIITLSDAQLKAWFMFPEQKQNWFGYSMSGNSGSGLGRDFANNLKYSLKQKFNEFGNETISNATHLEKLCLINEGVGKDNISDFTVNLIKSYLLDYTQQFAKQYLSEDKCKIVWVQKTEFNYETEMWERKQYYLPYHNNDYVILTPKDILTRDTSWINREDLYKQFDNIPTSIDNDMLRMQINQYFESQLARTEEHQEPTKAEKNKAMLATIKEYPEIIDYYIKGKEENGEMAINYSEVKVENTETILIDNTRALVNYLNENTDFYKNNDKSAYEEAMDRVIYLKNSIENNDCYKLFYNGNEPIKKEKDLQLMFRLVCCNSEFCIDAEVNNGRGPVDYKISKGNNNSSLIEFKLAKSTKLKQNLQNQVEIYEKANNTSNSIKAILYFTEEEQKKTLKVLNELGLNEKENIILIDARNDNKQSASNVK